MIGLINLIPYLILIVGGYLVYLSRKNLKRAGVVATLTGVVFLLYLQLQPSYGVKGEIKRSIVPTFEPKELQIKDVQPKPMSGEDRDERRKDLYKEPLPFLEKEVDNK